MRQLFGLSMSGNVHEAAAGISSPDAVIFITSKDNLLQHTDEIAGLFPGVPSLGGVGISYGGPKVNEKGVTVIGLFDVSAAADVITDLSTMPVKHIGRLEAALEKTGAGAGNSACFDFTTGNDGQLVTTLNLLLDKKKIPLIGGTIDNTAISVNGRVYEDACGFIVLKNLTGKICAYKENIYKTTGRRFLATKTDPKNKILAEVDGKPAAKFYQDELGITAADVATQTFKNPFGRIYGDETYLISVKEITGNSLSCYKQVNDMDILTIMELDDYKQVVQNTLDKISSDLGKVSGILSVNCLFRYLLFQQDHYLDQYLKDMNRFGNHAGIVGVGEHYCKQHINQTMTCIAFN
ncbi:MAG: FIST N-terminal domain-containing protein [Lachnospiraceae bacterium]|jgi:hypothetical protein|nr:FIST N-terminal domain-containing protein [Lachnospiraceae bacterium]MEE3460421.1 FIST N-terminal domain-containing protein [Lachnospiraceae bacterium]